MRSRRRLSRSAPIAGASSPDGLHLPRMKSGIGSRPWVGLDIGQFSIKLLTLQTTAKRAVHAERRRPAGEGERPAPSEELAVAISDCFSDAGLSPRAIRGISLGIAGV